MKIMLSETQLKNLVTEVSVKPDERVKIYQDERILVVAPLTHRSSCKYGANTPWCVAVASNDEHYKEYTENGILIYFIIKSPYPESKIQEYKFAYYHAFDPDAEEMQGWYDMADIHHNLSPAKDEDDPGPSVDKKLIKFLVPDFIFAKVTEYIKSQRTVFNKNKKIKDQQFFEFFINDPKNKVIVNDNDWFISYRASNFDTSYGNFGWYEETFQLHWGLPVYYANKHNKKIYRQIMPFSSDITHVKYRDNNQYKRINLWGKFDDLPEMYQVLKNYYEPISKAYFKQRKYWYSPTRNSHTYFPPEAVQVGDVYAVDDRVVVSKEKKHNGRYGWNITTRNKEGKDYPDSYYSEESGMGLVYDPERHNPV